MTRSLGSVSSIRRPHDDESRIGPPPSGGETEPSDTEHLRKLDYWAALNALRNEKNRLEADE